MEFTNIRLVYRTIRQKVIEGQAAGGDAQRARLLAYAFIRGRKYTTVEKITIADKFDDYNRCIYYRNLSSSIEDVLDDICGASEKRRIEEISEWINGTEVKHAVGQIIHNNQTGLDTGISTSSELSCGSRILQAAQSACTKLAR